MIRSVRKRGRLKRIQKVALLAVLVAVPPAASHATSSVARTPSQRFYVDGVVLSVASASEKLFVGGSFTLIGRPTGSWVAVDAAGSPLPGRPQVDGRIVAAARDGRGGWFVAGTISRVGSVEQSARVVHLRATGELDRGWRVSVRGGRISSIALHGNVLFLAGDFAAVGGKHRRGLAAVSARRGGVLPWRLRGDPQVPVKGKRPMPGSVSVVALSRDGRTLYVGGEFGRIGGRKRVGLAGVAVASGRVTGWNPSPNREVDAISTGRGRAVYVGGDFTRIGGAARNAVAAVDATTGRSLAFNAHASRYDSIYDLVATSRSVFVAGDFSSLGGRSRHRLAALDPRTGAVMDWEPTVTGGDVTALAVDSRGTTVYIGGGLTAVGGERRDRLAAVDARTGAVTPWDPRALGDVAILATGRGGTVFVGGDIAFVGGARRPGLASIGSDGSISDWLPALEGTVRALALSPDKARLYVGGAFAPGDARAQRNLAVVDVSTGALHAFGGGTNSGVWAIAPSADGSTVYIGGAFVTVAGKRRTRLAALESQSGDLRSWNSGANDLVRVLLPTADVLYVGGDFASAGGLPRRRLVQLDTTTGEAVGWNPEPDDNVWALALHDQTMFVGGEFGQIGGRTRNALAAVDVESGDATSWDPNADGTVRALALSDDGQHLYAAGEFEKIGRADRGYAEFLVADGSLTGWNPGLAFDGYTLTVGPVGSPVVIGGESGVDVFR